MKLRSEILALAIPAIVTNITTPLLALVDMAITGHIGEAVYIGAIAVGGTLFNTLYWLFNFLRMGTGGLAAQAYGAGRGADTVLARSLVLALFLGCLLVVLGKPVGQLALRFMDADDATAALAGRYFGICIWGAPAVLAVYVANGWLVGMQNTRATMWIAIATNVINIIVSATLVYGAGWKIEGVATGTLSAQWCGALIAAAVIWFRYRPKLPPLRQVMQPSGFLRFFRINADIFLRTACLVAVTLWFTHAGALQNVDTLAANALLLQLFMLFSFFMDGFAYAAEALAGKHAGRADRASVVAVARALMRTGMAFAVGFALLYLVLGNQILGLLTPNPAVLTLAADYLPWAVAMPMCGYAAFVYDGLLVGLTHTRTMLLAMACAMASFFALYFATRSSLGNHGLWLAFDVYLLVRGVVECVAMRRYERRK